jgi:hypothetical protein
LRPSCELARKVAKHDFHGRRQAHIQLGGIVLENRFSKNLVCSRK